MRELRELVSARHQLQSKRVALINTIRGYVSRKGTACRQSFLRSRRGACSWLEFPSVFHSRSSSKRS